MLKLSSPTQSIADVTEAKGKFFDHHPPPPDRFVVAAALRGQIREALPQEAVVAGPGQGLGNPKAGEGTGAGQEDPGHGQAGLKSGQAASRSDITRGSAGQSMAKAGSFQRTPSPFPGSKKRSIS